jgi:16S rRNA G966 N2-methylase RsmD
VFYDYSLGENEEYLNEFRNHFDLIIADPPFLSEECFLKTLAIVNRIKKESALIVFNTGSVQVELCNKSGLNESKFKPRHKNNLANQFSSFVNFDLNKYL